MLSYTSGYINKINKITKLDIIIITIAREINLFNLVFFIEDTRYVSINFTGVFNINTRRIPEKIGEIA
jgi:hypothetical protein